MVFLKNWFFLYLPEMIEEGKAQFDSQHLCTKSCLPFSLVLFTCKMIGKKGQNTFCLSWLSFAVITGYKLQAYAFHISG